MYVYIHTHIYGHVYICMYTHLTWHITKQICVYIHIQAMAGASVGQALLAQLVANVPLVFAGCIVTSHACAQNTEGAWVMGNATVRTTDGWARHAASVLQALLVQNVRFRATARMIAMHAGGA